MRACRRCDWKTDLADHKEAREAAASHALDSQHLLCVLCTRSLDSAELQTCLGCLGRVRRNLDQIVTLYALLPAELANLHGASFDATPKSGDGRPMPGGTALVLLADGSNGSAQPRTERRTAYPYGAPGRRKRAYDFDGERWVPVEEDAFPHSTGEGMHDPSDPPSVAFELSRWEDDLRGFLNMPAADYPAAVTSAAEFINARLTFMSREHPAFAEFTSDLRQLVARLEQVTHTGQQPKRAGVACFDCGKARLERHYRTPKPCPHESSAHHHCDQGGLLVDDDGNDGPWTCGACGRVYSQEAYRLAVRAMHERLREELAAG